MNLKFLLNFLIALFIASFSSSSSHSVNSRKFEVSSGQFAHREHNQTLWEQIHFEVNIGKIESDSSRAQ